LGEGHGPEMTDDDILSGSNHSEEENDDWGFQQDFLNVSDQSEEGDDEMENNEEEEVEGEVDHQDTDQDEEREEGKSNETHQEEEENNKNEDGEDDDEWNKIVTDEKGHVEEGEKDKINRYLQAKEELEAYLEVESQKGKKKVPTLRRLLAGNKNSYTTQLHSLCDQDELDLLLGKLAHFTKQLLRSEERFSYENWVDLVKSIKPEKSNPVSDAFSKNKRHEYLYSKLTLEDLREDQDQSMKWACYRSYLQQFEPMNPSIPISSPDFPITNSIETILGEITSKQVTLSVDKVYFDNNLKLFFVFIMFLLN